MPRNGASRRHKASPRGCLTARVRHRGRQDDLGDLCFVGKTNTDRGWEGSIRCPKSPAGSGTKVLGTSVNGHLLRQRHNPSGCQRPTSVRF